MRIYLENPIEWKIDHFSLLNYTEIDNYFGPDQWSALFGTVGTVPEIPNNINEILNTPCPFNPC